MHENGQLNLSFHPLWISLMFLSNIFCDAVNVDITLMVVPHFYLFIQSIIHFSAFVAYTLNSWLTTMHKTCRIKLSTKYKQACTSFRTFYMYLSVTTSSRKTNWSTHSNLFFYSCVILFIWHWHTTPATITSFKTVFTHPT